MEFILPTAQQDEVPEIRVSFLIIGWGESAEAILNVFFILNRIFGHYNTSYVTTVCAKISLLYC